MAIPLSGLASGRKGKSENRERREGVWYPGSVKDVNREHGQHVEGSAWGRVCRRILGTLNLAVGSAGICKDFLGSGAPMTPETA